jgi:hypothetical protein
MRPSGFRIVVAVLAAAFALSAPALTFKELAGRYVGHRTEATPFGVRRFKEIDVFEPDGTLHSFVYFNGILVFYSLENLEMNEDGTFSTGLGEGVIRLDGKHLEITGYFPTYGTTVNIQERQTDKPAHWQH